MELNLTPSALSLKNISKVFLLDPPVAAVTQVSLELPRGGFAALVGPSGSGKTTLLNLAAGLDTPSSGEVWISGQNLAVLNKTQLSEFRRRHLGFVFQAYNLFSTLTAIENVEFTATLRGDPPKQRRERALDCLARVGLSEKANFFPDQLSGGQQQRVAVARSLATDPDLIFADEPTANLDSKSAFGLIDLFQDLNTKLGVTFLFSTHDSRLVDRVSTAYHMSDGKLSYSGDANTHTKIPIENHQELVQGCLVD
jgi:putative ABC transport system ATP-binding protein